MTTKTEDTPAKRARPRRLTPVAPARIPNPTYEPVVIEYRGYRILDYALVEDAPLSGITDKDGDWVNCDLTVAEARAWIDEKINRGEQP